MSTNNLAVMLIDIAQQIPYKRAFLLFLAMAFVFSDFFNASILAHIPDSVYMENTTTKGTLIQILCVLLMFVILDILIQHNLI
jgi:hypothetical protein